MHTWIRYKARLSGCLLPLALSSCIIGTFAPTTRNVPFSEASFAGYERAGSGTISGQVSANYEGNHYIAQGELVRLAPVNAYTDEMVRRELGQGVHLTQADARYKKYVRYTKTDANGHYAFRGVPPGHYYVVGYTEWDTGNVDFPTDFLWGCERITLGSGQALQLNVTHDPHIHGSVYQGSWSGD